MKDLTLRYSVTQFAFWAAYTGAFSFATTYLLGCGLPSGTVGTLLAAAGVLSCAAQPVFAALVDRSRHLGLSRALALLALSCAGCLCALLLPGLSPGLTGLLYAGEIFLSNLMLPLMNALCLSYEGAGYRVNFGIGRALGSTASAVSSLVLGYVIALLGKSWMIGIIVAFFLLNIALFLTYPPVPALPAAQSRPGHGSTLSFFARYPWYCATLLGIAFLGMYHAMTENYMISIMERLGGDSSHVGIALFISSFTGAPVMFCFHLLRRRFSDNGLITVAACSFLLKALLLCFVGSIPGVYCVQLLQLTTYSLLEPARVYYARDSVSPADMVTGQAFSSAAYSLGCSGGTLVGGMVLPLGVPALLLSGVVMALIGTVLIFATIRRKDPAAQPLP